MSEIEIKKKMINGFLVTFIGRYSNVVIQLLITSILARMITPAEFGIVAIIIVFINFFQLISNMGISHAIVQNKELNNNEYEVIFNYSIILGLIIGVLFIIFSRFLVFYYNDPIFFKISYLVSVTIFFNCLLMVPLGILRKNKLFFDIAKSQVISNIISGLFAVIMAYFKLGIIAIIVQANISSMINFIILYKKSGMKIVCSLDKSGLVKIKKNIGYQSGFDIVNYFSRNLDNILIGKYLGIIELGFYDKAYKLMMFPIQNLSLVITPVMHPIFSDYQDNRELIYKYYKYIFKILLILGIAITFIMYFLSEEIIRFMYGEEWEASVKIFRLLSLTCWMQITSSSLQSIYRAVNETKKMFVSCIIFTSFILIGIIFGVYFKDLIKVIYGVIFGYTMKFFIDYYIMITRCFKDDYFNFIKEILIPLITIFLFIGIAIYFKLYTIKTTKKIAFIVLSAILYTGLNYMLIRKPKNKI